MAATAADPAITGIAFTRTGLSGVTGANSFNSSGWNSSGDYISFGFTIATGYTVDLTDLRISTRSTSDGPGFLGLYYNGDNFDEPLAIIVQIGSGATNSIIDLSGLVDLTGSIEFRIAQFVDVSASGSATQSTGTFRIQNHTTGPVQFNGSVTLAAIPEPTAALFASLLAGAFGLTVGRRPADRD